jgi:hypothetical protein
LHVREQDQFRVLARLKDGHETLQCGVDCTAERRGGDKLDLVMEGEFLRELATLFVA